MKNEHEIKTLLKKHLDKATDEISDKELKDNDFKAIWGEETINCMVDAAFAVYHATMEGQQHAIDEEFVELT